MTLTSYCRACGWLWLCVALAILMIAATPAAAQSNRGETTITGTVISATRNTLVIRGDDGQYHLFTYDASMRRQKAPAAGARIRITSMPGDEAGVRVANRITVATTAVGEAPAAEAEVVPPEIRRVERDIERQVRRYQMGVRAGVALDPELIMIGVQAQMGPFFSPNVNLRPNVEFGFGEVTAMFALNMDVLYRLPLASREGRWNAYVGLGPGFNFLHQNFQAEEGGKRVDFGDFHSAVGLNLLGGLRYRSGMFAELRTSVYARPAPTFKMIVGYNF